MKLFSLKNKGTKRILNIFGFKIKWRRKCQSQLPDISYFENKFKELQNTNQTQLNELLAYNKLTLMGMYPGYSLKDISKKVFSSYPKATGFLQEVQQCNLRLMTDFKSFCDSLNIKFWLHAGTLIGAIRNNGFVQWDDDVDVAMVRDDFNLMRQNILNNSLLELHEYYNDITCSRQYQLKYKANNIPVFIDIVIYDKCSATSPQEQNSFWTNYRATYLRLLNEFRVKIGKIELIDIGYYHVGLYPENIKKMIDELIDEATKNVCQQYQINEKPSFFYAIENYPFSYPIMKYNQLFPLKLINFENQQFYIPAEAEFYLQEGYRNIYLPPKDMNITPHLYAFEKYQNEIKTFLIERNK